MAENARPLELRVTDLEQEVAELKGERKIMWEAITALAERVAEATQVEEIIRRARAASQG